VKGEEVEDILSLKMESCPSHPEWEVISQGPMSYTSGKRVDKDKRNKPSQEAVDAEVPAGMYTCYWCCLSVQGTQNNEFD
jgi:hypothetical protein